MDKSTHKIVVYTIVADNTYNIVVAYNCYNIVVYNSYIVVVYILQHCNNTITAFRKESYDFTEVVCEKQTASYCVKLH